MEFRVNVQQSFEIARDDALEKVRTHQGPLIVDLDETLFLHNSTETFIGLAAPGLLAALMLNLLDRVKPWRRIGGAECRDNWRLALVMIFFPWTLLRWRRYCRTEVPDLVNWPLRDALLENGGRVIIASNGYRRLIQPMTPYLSLPGAELICCRLRALGHRRDGKAALVEGRIGMEAIQGALVITDSAKDADLLACCAAPCLLKWEDARFERAFEGVVYLPGDYLTKVKRPTGRPIRQIMREDLFLWLVMAASAAGFVWTDLIGAALLFVSMWCVYEIGYWDNDRCAERYEADPKLTFEYKLNRFRALPQKAAAWALAFGLLGMGVLHGPTLLALEFFGIWLAVLAALWGTYYLYNRIDKDTRVWIYPVLQVFRCASLAFVLPVGAIGFVLATAHIAARWFLYIVYRYVRTLGLTNWPKLPYRTIRLGLIGLLVAPILIAGDWRSLATPAAAVGIGWFAFLALRFEARKLLGQVHRLDRSEAA